MSMRDLKLNKKNKIYKNSNYKCIYCHISLEEMMLFNSYTIDHKIPRSRGGKDNIDNLCLCCRSCNSKKGVRTYDEYIKYLKVKDTVRYKKYLKEHIYYEKIFKAIRNNEI